MSTHTNYHLRTEITEATLSCTEEELLGSTATDFQETDIVKLIIGGILGNRSNQVIQVSKFE